MADVDSLQYESLTAAVEAIEIQNMMGIDFYRDSEDPIDGDTAEWDLSTDSRDVSGLTSRGAPSKELKGAKEEKKAARCAYFKGNFVIDGDNLNNLRQPGSTAKDKLGKRWLAKQLNRLMKREQMMREKLLWQAMSGTITETLDDGIALAVSMGRTGTHTVDVSGTNDWDTITNDPATNIFDWKKLIVEDSGRQSDVAWCNSSVMKMMFENTQVRNVLGENTVKERMGQDGTIGRYCGLDWKVWDGKHSGGSFITDDYVIITPEPGDWLGYKIGTVIVKGDDGEPAEMPSPASYSVVNDDPVAVKIIALSCFLPVLIVPDATIYAKVS